MENETKKVLILNDIRSVHNVGAIFRTADAIGISKIYITGYTASPIDRFGRKRQDLAKASLGAEESVSWQYIKEPKEIIKKLKDEDFKIIALEQSDKSLDYKKIDDFERVAILVGNEVDGISKELLDLSDFIAEIPMKGKKESLNVSVATGILLYKLFDK